MKIQIELKQMSTALTTLKEHIVLPEDELIIEFSSPVYDIKTLIVTARNHNKKKQFKVLNNTLDLTEFLIGGEIELEISSVIKGNVIKSWRVPNIIIMEVKHGFEVIDELDYMRNDYTQKFNEVYKALGEIKNIIKGE